MSSERTRPNTRLTRTNARFKLGEPTRHDLEFEGPSGGTRRRIMPAPRFWGHGDDVMNKALTVAAIACLGLLNGCMPAPSGGDGDEGDDSVVLIEDEGQGSSGNGSGGNGGGQTGGGGCGPDAVEAAPPGAPVGCYDLCTGGATCDAGFECRSFNGGALEICLPERNGDPDPEPDPETCPAGQVEANLAEYGRGCYTTCSGANDSVCSSDEECSSYQSGASYCTPRAATPSCASNEINVQLNYLDDPVCLESCDPDANEDGCDPGYSCLGLSGGSGACAPNAEVVMTQALTTTWGNYSVAADDLGRVHVFYVDAALSALRSMLGTSQGVFGQSTEFLGENDGGGVDNEFEDIRATAGPGGRVGLSWNVFSRSGFVPNAYFAISKYYAELGPVSDSGVYSSYELTLNTTESHESFAVSYAGTDLTVVANNLSTETIKYGRPGSMNSVFTPSSTIADISLVHDAQRGGHMVYRDDFNGVVYQHLPSVSSGGDQDDSFKLADQEDDDPAGLDMAIAPDGTVGVHMTFWENSKSEFCTGKASRPGGSVGSFDCFEFELFGAEPMNNAVTFSDSLGWVVCGGTSRGLECIGLSDTDRPVARTLISNQMTAGGSSTRNSVQLVSSSDGSVHVFWLQGSSPVLHHALIR